jgi:hypothetical protein
LRKGTLIIIIIIWSKKEGGTCLEVGVDQMILTNQLYEKEVERKGTRG